MQSNKWYKKEDTNQVWWLDNTAEYDGIMVFSFDRKEKFYLFKDYPEKLTPEQKSIFDRENPQWAEFFRG